MRMGLVLIQLACSMVARFLAVRYMNGSGSRGNPSFRRFAFEADGRRHCRCCCIVRERYPLHRLTITTCCGLEKQCGRCLRRLREMWCNTGQAGEPKGQAVVCMLHALYVLANLRIGCGPRTLRCGVVSHLSSSWMALDLTWLIRAACNWRRRAGAGCACSRGRPGKLRSCPPRARAGWFAQFIPP